MPTKTGGLEKPRVCFVEAEEEQDDEDKPEYAESEFDIDFYGVQTVGDIASSKDHVKIKLTPTEDATFWTNIPHTPDSGAPRTFRSEKHFGWILAKNIEVKLRKTSEIQTIQHMV